MAANASGSYVVGDLPAGTFAATATDNGDGTYTRDSVTNNGDGTYSDTAPGVTASGSYVVGAKPPASASGSYVVGAAPSGATTSGSYVVGAAPAAGVTASGSYVVGAAPATARYVGIGIRLQFQPFPVSGADGSAAYSDDYNATDGY